MKTGHWVALAVILLIGYFAGIFFPGPGEKLKEKFQGMPGG